MEVEISWDQAWFFLPPPLPLALPSPALGSRIIYLPGQLLWCKG